MNSERQGELIIFSGALLWSLFPVLTIISLKNIPALISLGWCTLFATIFFAVILSIKKKWPEVINKEARKDILLTTLILGIFYYLFYFYGLKYTSAGNAALIATTEIFFSWLFFQIWRKDNFPGTHLIGAFLMLIGAIIVLYPNTYKFQIGDILILSASLIAPLGNFFQKRARQKISSESILFVRCFISTIAIFILAYATHADFSSLNFKSLAFLLLIINGVFMFGLLKILWVEGIHRLSVTKAISLSSISPLLTLFFAWLFLQDIPTKFQLLSIIPILLGIFLLSKNGQKKVATI